MSEPQRPDVLISTADIQHRVKALAHEIRHDYPDGLHIIAVLKGAFIFMSDLVRDRDARDTSKAHFSLLADHRFNDTLSMRAGYTYAYAPTVRGDEFRMLFEQTLGFGLPWQFDLRLRTPPGFDRIEAEAAAQLLAQLADMAFNDVFLNVLVENPVNGIEYLRFADAPPAVFDEKFQNPPFAPRERQRHAL